MAVQSIGFSTSESTSNLQTALSYIMASCLQIFALGACGLFSYLFRRLWPTKQNPYLAALGF